MNRNTSNLSGQIAETPALSGSNADGHSLASPTGYFIKTSHLRYVGLYEADEVLAHLRNGSFEPDWLAVRNAVSQDATISEPPGQAAWAQLAILFPDYKSLPAPIAPAPPAPPALPVVVAVPAPPPAPMAAPERRGLKSGCKKCGAKISFFASLCKPCQKTAHETRLAEAKKREEDRKRLELEQRIRNTEVARDTLEQLVQAVTPDTPICSRLVKWDVAQKGGGGGGGVIVGGLLGGFVGAMIGSALTSSGGQISGELGIVVVTSKRVIVHHFTSPFISGDGKIDISHVTQLLRQINLHTTKKLDFDLRLTQVLPATGAAGDSIGLACRDAKCCFERAELIVNGVPFDSAPLAEINQKIAAAGTLPTPAMLVSMLISGGDPLPDDRMADVKEDKKYTQEVFSCLLSHPQRNAIGDSLGKSTSAGWEMVRAGLTERAAQWPGKRRSLRIKLAVLGIAILGDIFTHDFLLFASWVTTLSMAAWSLANATDLRCANWCRRIVMETLQNN